MEEKVLSMALCYPNINAVRKLTRRVVFKGDKGLTWNIDQALVQGRAPDNRPYVEGFENLPTTYVSEIYTTLQFCET